MCRFWGCARRKKLFIELFRWAHVPFGRSFISIERAADLWWRRKLKKKSSKTEAAVKTLPFSSKNSLSSPVWGGFIGRNALNNANSCNRGQSGAAFRIPVDWFNFSMHSCRWKHFSMLPQVHSRALLGLFFSSSARLSRLMRTNVCRESLFPFVSWIFMDKQRRFQHAHTCDRCLAEASSRLDSLTSHQREGKIN